MQQAARGGIAAPRHARRAGRKPQLSAEQLLLDGPETHGLSHSLVDLPAVARLIVEQLGIGAARLESAAPSRARRANAMSKPSASDASHLAGRQEKAQKAFTYAAAPSSPRPEPSLCRTRNRASSSELLASRHPSNALICVQSP